ncbi:MAG: hypothetical protein LQ340_004515 [Diploschistes diacapsis]|nr:MAG: hypothetical protein LQ340_004515 [Diploschistes diacapsis]
MHTVAKSSFWAAPRLVAARPCRFIAGRRFPLHVRAFRTNFALQDAGDDPSTVPNTTPTFVSGQLDQDESKITRPGQEEAVGASGEDTVSSGSSRANNAEGQSPQDNEQRIKGTSSYGSRANRASRSLRKIKEITLPSVPPWFLMRNVHLREAPGRNLECIEVVNKQDASEIISDESENTNGAVQRTVSTGEPAGSDTTAAEDDHQITAGIPDREQAKYKVDRHVYDEIHALVLGGLRAASSSRLEDPSFSKPHIVLQSPKEGATQFLTGLAEGVAHRVGADVIKVDAQDIAEIAGSISVDPPDNQNLSNAVRSLGYDVHIVDSDFEAASAEDGEPAEDGYEEGEEENPFSKMFPDPGPSKAPKGSSGSWRGGYSFSPFLKSVKVLIPYATSKLDTNSGAQSGSTGSSISSLSSIGKTVSDAVGGKEDGSDALRENLLFELFLDSPRMKRAAEQLVQAKMGDYEQNRQDDASQTHDLIIILEDYLELQTTSSGGVFLHRLHEAIRKKRKDGHRIILIGISTAEDLIPTMSKSGFRKIQTEARQGPFRTVITTCLNRDVESMFKDDEKARIKHINIRHIQDMLRRLAPNPSQIASFVVQKTSDITFNSASSYSWGLEDSVWSQDRVHRAASIALGLIDPAEKLTTTHLRAALDTIRESDQAKFTWLDEENGRQSPDHISSTTARTPEDLKQDQEDRMKKLRKTCTSHERKLLSGVIDSSAINTTFADVQAPAPIIEALKTLTSLSLIRPDAFTYGVLATDKIPGLLLYGPPGTGKTLLAKAVAKESGATVLEVSGSDIYDMYVGEGEKNVRALFTLARKLSPCVVFIDEADAMFGSRNTSGNRTSHRELINQFLREWDGMASARASAFIMVATNRPFDLDDAVLRRLPRRLMVDLPTWKDREAILKIHLKDEALDPSVSVSELANKTPFYSGSDLKNLCVAAALACVKAENDAVAQAIRDAGSASSGPHAFPAKRTLTGTHFDKALSEISASVSEDMSSLAAIRKFDEKYGDRRGRKKGRGMGFGNKDAEKEAVERDREREREKEREMEREKGL